MLQTKQGGFIFCSFVTKMELQKVYYFSIQEIRSPADLF